MSGAGGWVMGQQSALLAAPVTVRSQGGQIGLLHVLNPNTATAYLQLFDNATPTVGTDAPKFIVGVPAGEQVTLSGSPIVGLQFLTAITMAATTTPTGGTAPTTGVVVSYGFH